MTDDINRAVIRGTISDPPRDLGGKGTGLNLKFSRSFKAKDGSQQTVDNYISVTCWNNEISEDVGQLSEGDTVTVDGRLQYNSWVAKDGTKKGGIELVANQVQVQDDVSASTMEPPF